MASVDGEEGIKLKEFIEMWTEDGTKLNEEDRKILNGHTWLLYSVYFPESTNDYGRHMAIILKMNTTTEVILMHDVENLSGSVIGGGHRSLEEWFEKHVGKY